MRGRFAPSPTGDLHLGNARTALLAWLHARSAGGTFVLRMEDLDAGRVREEARTGQLLDLRWLGLEWDEGPDVGGEFGPYTQSARTEWYEAALGRLRESGLVYPCVCSRKEIAAAASAPHDAEEDGPAYPGTCAGRPADARPSALRFRTPDRPVSFHDAIHGVQRRYPAREIGDFVVRRKDGVAAYQLAVVVDDAAMAITDVVRGADLLSSTARQILLYEALGVQPPRWTHVPLMLGEDGERLAKRHGALSLRELRERGASPERVVGWLAESCGLVGHGAEVRPADLLTDFEPAAIRPEPTVVRVPTWLARDVVNGP